VGFAATYPEPHPCKRDIPGEQPASLFEATKMKDTRKTKEQLIHELIDLRQRSVDLETERGHAKEALRDSETRYLSLFEGFPIGLYRTTLAGEILDANHAFVQMLGYPDKGSLLAVNVTDLYADARDRTRWQTLMEREGVVHDFETQIRRLDGTIMWVLDTARAVRDRDGSVCYEGSLRDITRGKKIERALRQVYAGLENRVRERTGELAIANEQLRREIEERKRTEEALRESEEKYRSLVDHIGIGVALISQNMEILTLNNQMKKWFPDIHVAKKPICYKTFNDPPRESVCAYCPTYKTLQDGEVHESVTETPAANKIVNYRIVSTPIKDRDGNIIAAIEMVEDITESRRMQEALRESEAKYRTIFETTASATMIVEEDTTISLINTAFEELTGYSKEEVEGKRSWTEIAYKDDLPSLREYHRLRRIDPKAAPRNYEFRFIDKDGRIRDAFTTVAMLPGTKKSVISVLDITDRKRADERLRENEALFRNLTERSLAAVFIVQEGKFRYINTSAIVYAGYTAEELIGRDSDIIVHPDDKEMVKEKAREILQGRDSTPYEFRMVTKEGQIRFIIQIVSPIQYNGKPAILGNAIDITGRKRAEEALRESEARLRALIGNLPFEFWAMDGSLRYIMQNAASLRSYGDVVGKRIEDLQVSAAVKAKWLEQDMKVLQGETIHEEYQRDMKGEKRFYEKFLAPVIVNEAIIGIVGAGIDVTKRKQAEEKLRLYQEQLRFLASELSVTEERERRRLATDLHDSISQILAISKLKLDLVRDGGTSAAFGRELDEISALIDQALQHTRSLTFELSPPVLYELGLEAALESLVERLQHMHGLHIEFVDDEQPKALSEDLAAFCFRAVQELLINVVKHARARTATITTEKYGDKVRIVVADDGVGFVSDDTFADVDRRTGFGLFSISERLRHLGGSLEIHSRPSQGTRVTLLAPLERLAKGRG
jgi:PAS domain S-box-containing protein